MASRAAKAGSSKPSSSKGVIAVFLISMLACGALFVPTAMLLVVGLLPTVASLLIDNDRKKSLTTTIGLMNLAGVVPFVIELWKKGQTVSNATSIIQQPIVWLFMYGAAAMGWLIVYSVPAVVSSLLAHRANGRITDIDKRHAELIQLWGEGVRPRHEGDKPKEAPIHPSA